MPLISCLMPTFNRGPELAYLVEESIESFLRQDHPDKELIICNDTPGYRLHLPHNIRNIRTLNLSNRLPTLSDKIQLMITEAKGEYLCRWDDDDISLPHRLALSLQKIGGRLEWRSSNHWYDVGTLSETPNAGNSHVHSLWHRDVLKRFPGGVYPQKLSGNEDQTFNQLLVNAGIGNCDRIPREEIYYLYRWNTGSHHLSGLAGPRPGHQDHYDALGREILNRGDRVLFPQWYSNHIARVQVALRRPVSLKNPMDISSYCDYHRFYDAMVAAMPRNGKMVEVGCLSGHSTCYLANEARLSEKRLTIYAVDPGIGIEESNFKRDFTDSYGLLENIRECGDADIIVPILTESTKAAQMFANTSLDFVFLDGAHDYQAIRSDLQAWFPKIKGGGIIAGHDYNHPNFPGVRRAVDEFFEMGHPGLLAWGGIPSVWHMKIE